MGTIATALAYAIYNLVYAAAGWPAGAVSDRVGRRPLLVAGFLLFALVYGGMGLATKSGVVWPLLAVYGLYMALTDGISKAYITDLVPDAQRGGALGLNAAVTGGVALLSSVLAGLPWDHVAPSAPFYLGGITALGAAGILLLIRPRGNGGPTKAGAGNALAAAGAPSPPPRY